MRAPVGVVGKDVDSSLELQESGWEELRKEARKVEGDIDVKLSSYSKVAARFTHSSGTIFPSIPYRSDWQSMVTFAGGFH
ncbi:hypothetical protein HPP92_028234 [Vanilla planifolia]|uniref:Uncharacterized protein n=1 Tax=Vanilla planifolia TaxID=51239 RepID=A0A835P8L4_VANPL|nr:hypothetical protein HPP92_028234 [Vanilla planifolia]